MGIETRWICHTCQTIYDANGFNDYFCIVIPPTLEEAKRLKELLEFINNFSTIDRLKDFLIQYISWREYHKGHKIFVTNDYQIENGETEYEYFRENEYHEKSIEPYRSVEE